MDDMEQRVWQRVRSNAGPGRETALSEQINGAMELGAVYGHLLKSAAGPGRELLRQLQEGEQANIACLKGIAWLERQKTGGKTPPVPREPARKLLEQCYHRSRRAAIAFMAHSAGGEYAEVYRAMADREGRHCVLLAQLLGMQ